MKKMLFLAALSEKFPIIGIYIPVADSRVSVSLADRPLYLLQAPFRPRVFFAKVLSYCCTKAAAN